jgi:hypothetical protein
MSQSHRGMGGKQRIPSAQAQLAARQVPQVQLAAPQVPG